MLTGQKRKIKIVSLLSLCLTFFQLAGWQISMKYGTSVHRSSFLQRIGVLPVWGCACVAIVEFFLLGFGLFALFSWAETRAENVITEPINIENRSKSKESPENRRGFWIGIGAVLFAVYLILLLGCYPGFYNYDVGIQIPQVLYEEVPYDAHHPLLHTWLMGKIIALGYRIYHTDLSFGIFLYCAFQMLVCAICLTYALHFLHRITHKKSLVVLAFSFYALCPPIVLFAMSTTKDCLCYSFLLVSVLKLYEIYREKNLSSVVPGHWIRAAVPMVISCMLRNNIIYGVIVFALFAVIFVKKNRRAQILFFASVVVLYSGINTGMIRVAHAAPASITEALSVPLQQFARLYVQKGEEAFEIQERELLFSGIDEEMIYTYDPFISDRIKYSFWLHLDVLKARKGEFIRLWIRKGLQYPTVYFASFLDNTYQAWYPGTVVIEGSGYHRYFLTSDWNDTDGKPFLPALYQYYKGLNDDFSYVRYPIIRVLFATGTMVWTAVSTWFYGIWLKKREIITTIGLVLLVCATSLCGPVSDVRYYLILFYMMPVCVGMFLERKSS